MTEVKGKTVTSRVSGGGGERQAHLNAMAEALQADDLARLLTLLEDAETRLRTSLRHRHGHAASLEAREMVRRAERYVAMGVRRGQEAGRIETTRESSVRVLMESRGLTSPSSSKVKTREVLPGVSALYAFADAPMARFEAALATSRQRNRMGRDDVKRELKRLAAEAEAQRPEELRGRRRLDVNQVIEAAIGASGIQDSVAEELDWTNLDLSRAEAFDVGLRDVINSLDRLRGRVNRRRNAATRVAARGRGRR